MESAWSGWIGLGGGRGAAKSGGADRIVVALSLSQKAIVSCVVMRNYDQVRKYHIEPILRTFPELRECFTSSTSKMKMPDTLSEIDFSYAENLEDVKRRFRSGNYKYIIVDQAEQFTEDELREMRLANRWPGGGAIMLLLFNMGGVGIQTLSKWFNPDALDYNEHEDPTHFKFLHVYPWDNVEWSRSELSAEGLTEDDYYSWSDKDRFEYFIYKTDYGKSLNSLDDALRARDLLGSWNSLEGAYFGRVFDRQATMIDMYQVQAIQKPWDKRWLGQDWGKSHFCCTLWNSMSMLSPLDAKAILGWETSAPLKVVITYRSLIVNEMTSAQVGQEIVKRTPEAERKLLKSFYLSPDAFGSRDSPNTIADNQGAELRKAGMPLPSPADTDRPGGWGMMHSLLWNTKTHGLTGDTVWLICSECPELLESIPILMRDPKDLDVVLKTDKGQARLEQDVSETARYSLKSMLGSVAKPFAVIMQEAVQLAHEKFGGTAAHIAHLKMEAKRKGKQVYRRQY